MKSFLKIVFGSFIGVALLFTITSLIIMLVVGGLVKSFGEEEKVVVKDHSILRLDLNYDIPDRSMDSPTPNFGPLGGGFKKSIGLNDIVTYIEHAKTDDQIEGIYIKLGNNSNGFATLEEIREALKSFKSSGKFIVGYAEMLNEKGLYLGSLANELYVHPGGIIEFNGFVAQMSFYKKMLDNLGIKFEVFYAGKFKSATEPIRETKMSDANRKQLREYLNSINMHYLNNVAGDLSLSPKYLDSLANTMAVINPHQARIHRLITASWYSDQVRDRLMELTTVENDEEEDDDDEKGPNFISLKNYRNASKEDVINYHKDQIAILFAEGPVNIGKGQDGSVGSTTYVKALRKLRKKENVKAIVLRVNSPGGASIAGESIWREVKLAAEEKPVIVSMGNLGASAAYHFSCTSAKIYAQPNTLTGSIGVFFLVPIMEKFLEDKIGITSDTVKTNQYADILSSARQVTEFERKLIQEEINKSYADFLQVVAEGRDMDTVTVSGLAQGRIWSGLQAKENGLIDEIGGLNDAIAAAAEMADLDEYMTRNYPVQENFFEKLFGSFGSSYYQGFLQDELGVYYQEYSQMKSLMEQTGRQARMPYEITIH